MRSLLYHKTLSNSPWVTVDLSSHRPNTSLGSMPLYHLYQVQHLTINQAIEITTYNTVELPLAIPELAFQMAVTALSREPGSGCKRSIQIRCHSSLLLCHNTAAPNLCSLIQSTSPRLMVKSLQPCFTTTALPKTPRVKDRRVILRLVKSQMMRKMSTICFVSQDSDERSQTAI